MRNYVLSIYRQLQKSQETSSTHESRHPLTAPSPKLYTGLTSIIPPNKICTHLNMRDFFSNKSMCMSR